jgi:FkbM family methyltransferase
MGVRDLAKAILPQSLRTRIRAYVERWSGEPELRLLPALCDPRRIAVDVGANRGYFTYFLSRRATLTHAFEPIPELAERLKADFPEKVVVHNIALSDEAGEAVLRIPQNTAQAGMATLERDNALAGLQTREIRIQKKRLDELGLGPVGFIKIDVEGHEGAVLAGARQLLERDRPNLLIEIEERHKPGSLGQVLALLGPLGYRGFYYQGDHLVPAERFDAARDQDPARLTLPGGGSRNGYVNNFLLIADTATMSKLPAVA